MAKLQHLVDEKRAVDIANLYFSKAFDTVCHLILIDKLLMYELYEQTVSWIENRMNGCTTGWWSVVSHLGQ